MRRLWGVRRLAGAKRPVAFGAKAAVVAVTIFFGLAGGARAASSTTAVNSSLNPSLPGQSVTFTATVGGTTAGVPTGTVTFKDGGTTIGGAVAVNALRMGGSLAAGEDHTCAVTAVGSVKCWGLNDRGQLGVSSNFGFLAANRTPATVTGLTSGIAAVAAGLDQTCALTTAGRVKCWGNTGLGAFGPTPIDVPVAPGGPPISGIAAIAAGGQHACALTKAGGVKCWGIGDPSDTPGDVLASSGGEPIRDIIAIAAGREHTCALNASGGVQCWGDNFHGQLGDGSNTSRNTSAAVSGLSSGVTEIAAGVWHSCALMASGGVKCWGENQDSQLGDGTTTQRLTPVDVLAAPGGSPITGLVGIAAGFAHTCAVVSSGTIKCWGENIDNQLGQGSAFGTHSSTPIDVYDGIGAGAGTLVTGIVAIAAGGRHNCVLTATAAAKCWGDNEWGARGDNGVPWIVADVTDFGDGTAQMLGKAKVATSALSPGSHNITAAYSGDGTHTGSTSSALIQAVNKPAAVVSLGASASSTKFGQSVTFTATVTVGATGTVTFKDGATTLGSKTLSGGHAIFSIAVLAVGSHTITATYGGDNNYSSSTSSGLSHAVTKGATTLTAIATPATVKPGGHVTLKGTIHVTAPASATPTGQVTFKDAGVTIGVGAVTAGVGQFTVTPTSIGTRTITATYSGDTHLAASAATTSFTVSAATTAEAKANKFTKGAQQFPAIARLKSGTIVVWASNGQDGSGTGIYGQRYNASGVKQGAELHISTAKAGNQTLPKVTGLSAGGFVVTWQSDGQDGSGSGIYAQRYNANGGKLGAEFRVNKTVAAAQTAPAIAAVDTGFVIAWVSNGQDKSGLGIYAQRYNASGGRLGTEFKVNTTTAGAQSMPAVAGLKSGFVVAWQSADAKGLGIFGQRYDKAGKAAGKQFAVNKTTAGDESLPSVAGTSDGGFVVAWQAPDSSGTGVYLQRFTSTAVKNGGEVRANTFTAGNQFQPNISAFTNGGFVMLWTSQGQDGSGKGVYAQVFKSTGAKANVEFLVNTTRSGDQSQPAAAANSTGAFMAAWTSRGAAPSLEDVDTARFQVPLN